MSARTVRALWAVVPFALVVAVVAFALVGAPGIDHGLATTKVPTHSVLTRRDWVDIAVGSLFVIVAVGIAGRLLLRRRVASAGATTAAPPGLD
ncbi:hypothetical protein IT072_02005 [Leifsonia sp. ZF2019]|uniref:hypothetical protein n=1 Tax=Leifsonia sp. ZF2019 TaxID=2781978 RepID=UPI001CC112DB|nr:hypothetical protein [Leifsonia sp. ZF2019]UAJ79876.1 hypothetical protein IT072_02005 [Leifsonia sp. ZF2019]